MNEQASEHMNSTNSPISSGSPKRFIGTSSKKRATSSGELCAASWNGVLIGPGEIETARMPAVAYARAPHGHRHHGALGCGVMDRRARSAAAMRHARHVDDDAMLFLQHVRQHR